MPTTLDATDAIARIRRLPELLENPRAQQALRDALDDARDVLRRHYMSEKDPKGRPWIPWQLRRPKASPTKKTLFDSGRLFESVVTHNTDNAEIVTETTAAMGTRVPYAAIHQEGAEIISGIPLVTRDGKGYIPPGTKINIPARPFIGVNDEIADAAAKRIADHIVNEIEVLL